MLKKAKKVKVLIIDDEAEFLKSISKALSRRDLFVRTAKDGAEALEILERQLFDVVLLDMKMPGMSGEQTFSQISARWPYLAIIILTGHPSTPQAFRTSREGVFDYVAKPCDIEVLTEKIRTAASEGTLYQSGESSDQPVRLLIVDDEEEFLVSLTRVLTRRGMLVAKAANSVSALKLLSRQPFDVALLDIKMPRIDGIQLFHQIKIRHPLVEVIMLTGHPSVETAFESSRVGAFRYLTKPPDIEELTRSIREAYRVSRHRTEQEREMIVKEILEKYPDF